MRLNSWFLACAALVSFSSASVPASTPSNQEILERTSQAFNEVARKATPTVVSISAVKAPDEKATMMGKLFGMPGVEGHDAQPVFGMGSGVVIREDGVILTNNHVVEGANEVTVQFDEKNKMKAEVIGADPKTDLAVIKLKGKHDKLPVITFGDSDSIQVGDWAVAIGNPFGLQHSVTSGIISAKGRGHMGVVDTEDFIQTDAAINPGNSGGPLLNIKGEMIGLNAAIFSQSGGFIGIGFSIPSNLAKQVSQEILDHGRVIRGWIGVLAQDLEEPELAHYFKVPPGKGALVSSVSPGGPADQGNLHVGDVIQKYNNATVADSTALKKLVTQTHAGTQVPMEVARDGKTRQIWLTVREQPVPRPRKPVQQAGRAANGEENKRTLGLFLQDIPPELASILGAAPGTGALVVDVVPGSPAFDSGMGPGDVILKANEQKISSAGEFQKFAKKMGSKETAVLYVQRGDEGKIFVPITMKG